MKVRILFFLLLCLSVRVCVRGQRPCLLPMPRSVEWGRGTFRTDRAFAVVNGAGREGEPLLRFFAGDAVREGAARRVEIYRREVGPSPEAYRLDIGPDTLRVYAAGRLGLLRASQTLAQLRGRKGLACVRVDDAPEMAWRGLMIDVSRHFFPLSFLLRQVDLMARCKLNRLHLHLTDAAGWRMEIRRYPLLAQQAAWRTEADWKTWWNEGGRRYASPRTLGAYGGCYTQEELRRLVAYAEARGVTVVPEIEMPAHSEEVLTAYPELSCTHEPYRQADFCPGNEETFVFLENVLREVMEVFPSVYIHLGGDEAGKASWRTCGLCRARADSLGLDSTDGLQDYLMARMGRFLAGHGRRMVAWDEAASPELPAGALLTVWRGPEEARRAAEAGQQLVLCPGSHCYFDFYQDAPPTQPEAIGGFTPAARVYAFSPRDFVPDSLLRQVAGVQGNLWTEYVATPAHAEYMLYPRAWALAEVGWTGSRRGPWADFRRRAVALRRRLAGEGAFGGFDLRRERGERPEAARAVDHLGRGARVTYGLPYHARYAAAGDGALTDGLRGGWSPADGRWQGFIRGRRFDVTLDLGRVCEVRGVACGFLQSVGAEIYFPSSFRVSVSADGREFEEVHCAASAVYADPRPAVRTERWKSRARRVRYVRVEATPDARGGWVFADEVVVE